MAPNRSRTPRRQDRWRRLILRTLTLLLPVSALSVLLMWHVSGGFEIPPTAYVIIVGAVILPVRFILPRQFSMRTLLLFVTLLAVCFAWYFDSARQQRWTLQRIRAGLRDNDRDAEHALEVWLSENLVLGKTTLEQVTELFGHDYTNLDRPARDSIVTIQYDLEGFLSSRYLVFDFDSTTKTLRESRLEAVYRSGWICGYCPHVSSDDGTWRLEGKMLAGCVGPRREGVDTLVLPRLTAKNGHARIRLSNLAPEREYLDSVQLGYLPLSDGEELDVDLEGSPFVWKPTCQREARRTIVSDRHEELTMTLGPSSGKAIIVLEVRNTTEFETATREHLLGIRSQPVSASILIRFDNAKSRTIQPVGTKFLRRIVVPIPPDARRVTLRIPRNFWLVRRIWEGTGDAVASRGLWRSPVGASRTDGEIVDLIRSRDGKRICLEPMDDVELLFAVPDVTAERGGYVLRMSGYYTFLEMDRRLLATLRKVESNSR